MKTKEELILAIQDIDDAVYNLSKTDTDCRTYRYVIKLLTDYKKDLERRFENEYR